MALTDSAVRNCKPSEKPYTLKDIQTPFFKKTNLFYVKVDGVRLENGKYPTLTSFFKQWVFAVLL